MLAKEFVQDAVLLRGASILIRWQGAVLIVRCESSDRTRAAAPSLAGGFPLLSVPRAVAEVDTEWHTTGRSELACRPYSLDTASIPRVACQCSSTMTLRGGLGDGGEQILLCTDLDDTLLGDAEALRSFNECWRPLRARGCTLVYNTGRSLADYLAVLSEWDLLTPDVFVGGCGTQMHAPRQPSNPVHTCRQSHGKTLELSLLQGSCALSMRGRYTFHPPPARSAGVGGQGKEAVAVDKWFEIIGKDWDKTKVAAAVLGSQVAHLGSRRLHLNPVSVAHRL